ncbi:ribonuclease Z 1 [Aspergillus udagawae]|uniref:ribonuclease Z n=1 Tax=Aspergillus udagawae TaxID=91492 RepID=A0ABQ1B167_9EURO|nr:ribonuclease Z 1 [Aspergillus udagawae]
MIARCHSFLRAASYLKSRRRVYEGISGPPKSSLSHQYFDRPLKARRTRDLRREINPDAYLLRAPKLEFRRGKTYILYNPALRQGSDFDSIPTSPVGNKPMKFYYQVLTTPTADTPGTTLVLHFPDKRYFFGQISEGTQRACTERGVKLSYLTDIFLTGRTEWATNGGLIGVILTLADGLASAASALELTAREKEAKGRGGQNVKQQFQQQQDGQADRGTLTIHGGRNLTHTLATARRFVFRKGMPVFTKEYDSESLSKSGSPARAADPFEQPTWSDRNIKVWAMPIRPSPSQRSRRTSPQARPQSPRKRSLDEFQERDADKPALDKRAQDHIMRQSVISDMFNSSWRMDALVETPLAEVKMPAIMFIRDPETKDLKPYNGPAPGSDKPLPDIKVLVRQPWPGASVEKLPPTTRCDEAVSYIVRNHDLRGKFDPQKAKDLNVRAGPNFARLTKGENVLSEDGKTVTPDMVLGPPRLGKGLAIIDLPTSDYVDDLVDRPEWNSAAVTTGLEAFLWILGPGVGDHPRLREFVARMSHCKHTVSSTDYCPNYLALSSVAGSSIRLARLRGENYPVPVHDNKTLPQPGTPTCESETTKEMIRNSPFEPINPGLVINMEPKFELNRSEVVPLFNPAETVQTIPRSIEQRVTAIRRRVMKPQFQEKLAEFRKDLPGANVEIVTLGTGSSSPSKYRNVSSTLVNVPGVGSYLLDCGENTIGQLKRMYEPKKLQEVLQNLRLIWISHLHADHHLGTASVIREWFRANYPNGVPRAGSVETDIRKILQDKRLFVVSEEMMIGWLEEYAGVEDYGFGKLVPLAAHPSYVNGDLQIKTKFTYRHCRDDGSYPGYEADGSRPQTSTLDFNDDSSPVTPLLRQATGLADILTTKVSHCRGAMAVSLVFPDGFKLSFSGDCRPSANFATIGRDSTVLIHEATFQDDMAVSAVAKKHSTTSEALEVGRMMQARTVVLTHFSQRYQKVAHVDPGASPTEPDPQPRPAPMAREDLDVPDHEPEPAHEPSTLTVTENKLPLKAPVTAAFDYMRIRVGDIPIAQAFAPAVEKLFDILERASAVEANKQKKIREAADALAKEKKQMKRKGASEPEPASASALAAGEVIDMDQGRSVWSASESESGWGSSDDEWMDRFWRGKHSRSRSQSWNKGRGGRRSSPSIRTKSSDAA